MFRPTQVFVSYSHKDEELLTELLGSLQGLEAEGVRFWADRQIVAGDVWDVVIQAKIRDSDISMALVSQAFLDSRYCMDVEIRQLLAQKALLLPLILSPCEWTRHEWLNRHQFLPRDGRSITEHDWGPWDRQNFFLEVRSQLRELAERLKAERLRHGSGTWRERVGPRKFEGDALKGQDWRGKDLSGCEFRDCDLSGISFAGCSLREALFFRSKALRKPLDLAGADLTEATIEGCQFPDVILSGASLKGARLLESSFRNGRLTRCSLDGCTIEGLDIALTQLDKASFREATMHGLTFRPVRRIPFLRGLRFLRPVKVPIERSVDVTQVAPSPFTAFCLAERRKDQLFSAVAPLPAPLRVLRLGLLAAYGIVSDFGSSLTRWFFLTCTALGLFTLAYRWVGGGAASLVEALQFTIGVLFGHFPHGAEALALTEVFVGLPLAGVGVAVIARRFFER